VVHGGPAQCTDIDECSADNGGCADSCANAAGSYACVCESPLLPDPEDDTNCVEGGGAGDQNPLGAEEPDETYGGMTLLEWLTVVLVGAAGLGVACTAFVAGRTTIRTEAQDALDLAETENELLLEELQMVNVGGRLRAQGSAGQSEGSGEAAPDGVTSTDSDGSDDRDAGEAWSNRRPPPPPPRRLHQGASVGTPAILPPPPPPAALPPPPPSGPPSAPRPRLEMLGPPPHPSPRPRLEMLGPPPHPSPRPARAAAPLDNLIRPFAAPGQSQEVEANTYGDEGQNTRTGSAWQ
jgi:hypothetical protein